MLMLYNLYISFIMLSVLELQHKLTASLANKSTAEGDVSDPRTIAYRSSGTLARTSESLGLLEREVYTVTRDLCEIRLQHKATTLVRGPQQYDSS